MDRVRDLQRIEEALTAAAAVLADYTPGFIDATRKSGGDPVTEADEKVDELLRELLPEAGDGWLSEETVDSPERLAAGRVWVVDPLDGTREFVEGIPEWCVSIGLVENGVAVAGGILNTVMDQRVVGSLETGVTLNGEPAQVRPIVQVEGAEVLASRSEVRRGEWDHFQDGPIIVRPMGSVAYKMALVAAGLADATWTLDPEERVGCRRRNRPCNGSRRHGALPRRLNTNLQQPRPTHPRPGGDPHGNRDRGQGPD